MKRRSLVKKDSRDLLIPGISLLAFLSIGAFLLLGYEPVKESPVIFADSEYSFEIVGTNRDGFDAPDGILWREGRIYMADEGGAAFRIWSENRKTSVRLSSAADGIESPEDFVVASDGTIFFTDDDAGGLWRIDPGGNTSLLAGKKRGLISTEGIALNRSGEILVGDGAQNKIYKVDRRGRVKVFLDSSAGVKKPESLAFDERGNLYIADNLERILYRLDRNGRLEKLISNRADFSPETIWFFAGELFITDSDNFRLYRYSPEKGLALIAEFGGVFKKVAGLTSDDRGNLYISVQTHIDNKKSFLLRLNKNRRDSNIRN